MASAHPEDAACHDGGGPVVRQVLRLAGPAVLASLMQTLVFLADRLMLGRYSQQALASMQVQGPVLWSLFSIFMGALVGTVALVSRSVGAGELERARDAARTSLRLAAAIGLGLAAVGSAGAGWVALALGPEDPVLIGLSRSYMQVAFLAMPGLFLGVTAAMILQGAGDTRTPFLMGAVANAINIALNAVLIFGAELGPIRIPELGVVGAAAGTTVAFAVEAALLLAVLHRRGHPVRVRGLLRGSPAQALREPAVRRDLLAISGPAILDRLAVHVGFLLFVRVVNSLGPTAMAANQALVTLESICFLSADGFAVAAATVVGQRLGRGEPALAARGAWIAVGLGVATLVAAGLAIWGTAPWTLPLFVAPGEDGGAMLALARACLPILALAQPFMAAAVVLAQALRGAGDTRAPFHAAAVGSLLVRVGLAWLLARALGWGLLGIWWASTADWLVRTLWLQRTFRRGRWTQRPEWA